MPIDFRFSNSHEAQRKSPSYIGRAGSRIVANMRLALHLGHSKGLFHYQDAFVYRDNNKAATIRNRASLDPAEKKIEYVAPEELDLALLDAVRTGFSMVPEDAVSEALGMIGFGRATTKIAGLLSERLNRLISEGRLLISEGRLTSS